MADVTWSEIEELLEGKKAKIDRETKETREKYFQGRMKKKGEREKRKWGEWERKSKEAKQKYAGLSVKELGELAEDRAKQYFKDLQGKIYQLRREHKGETALEKRRFLGDLAGFVRKESEKLKGDIEWARLGKPSLVNRILKYVKEPSKILDYIRERSKKAKTLYLIFLILFFGFYAFRNNGSVIGYTVVEGVTSNYLSYFLVFVLVICLIVFCLDKK